MLTKNDLSQIRKVVREEVENESQAIKEELGGEIASSRMRVQSDVAELKDRTKNLEIRVTKMHKDLKKEIKIVSHVLDKENIQTARRVSRVEEHLGIAAV